LVATKRLLPKFAQNHMIPVPSNEGDRRDIWEMGSFKSLKPYISDAKVLAYKPSKLSKKVKLNYSTGLEILSPSGVWEPVPALADTLIINIGDLMAMWTNDRWVSTLHRVVNS